MSLKDIFVATHPRACSTAFERVFMTRDDILSCVHEPFGDAFYFGPERLSTRYENDKAAREASGFAQCTFKSVFERLDKERKEGKRLFIKDITHYLVPPDGRPAVIAPSLIGLDTQQNDESQGQVDGISSKKGSDDVASSYHKAPSSITERDNPTVVPTGFLKQFHFTFLIRHPRHSIPSYWRCTIPPLDDVTGFHDFMPSEAGYDELRRFFDFLRAKKEIGPSIAGENEVSQREEVSIVVIDADDLLDNPEGIIKAFCKAVDIDYRPQMLVWDSKESHDRAKNAFEKWKGFHNDAIQSTSLKPRSAEHKRERTAELEDKEWCQKYGDEAQRIIRQCVDANISDYEYLKSFALKV